jgi:transmembrane sensor
MNRQSEIEEVASLWVAREDRGLTTEEARLERLWLDESTEHLVAYLRLKSLWRQSDGLAGSRIAQSAHPRRSFASSRVMLAAAALLICMAGGTMVFYIGGRHLAATATDAQQYSTGADQQKTVKLADGTRIELNKNTRVIAEDTTLGRAVHLVQGEVYFDVVHDSKHPFTVLAGNRRITDLGTKFSVLRENDYVKVVVKEGRVRIDLLGTQLAGTPVIASQDNVAVIKGEETLVAAKGAREIDDELNWRYQMLVFDQERLADVAAQFNRYNKRQILVEGEARKIHIGGRFRSDNIEAFVDLMKKAFQLKVTENRDQILISD